MRKALVLLVGACALLTTMTGCSNYYKIRDISSNQEYYTDDYDRLSGGAIRFKDSVTQQTITLGSSKVMNITKNEYKANIHGQK